MPSIKFGKLDNLEFKVNEAFKTLRTNLSFCGEDIKVITITSSTPNEGKSAVAFELCRSIAESGKKVLLIDADIRKSVLKGRYHVEQDVDGLSHYLTGQKELKDIIYQTNVDKLNVIFTGPIAPNPAELLGSKKFADLLAKERSEYDYVIIDSPPLGSVIDSALIAKDCDGAVLVIESGAVSYKLVQRVKLQLEKSGCRILGAVLNKVELDGKGYYGNYYGNYYGKYGDYTS